MLVVVALALGQQQQQPPKELVPFGVWNCSLELDVIRGQPTLTFKQDGEKVTGTYTGRYGDSPLAGTVKDRRINFVVTINAEGTQSSGTFEGTVEGDRMGGAVNFEGGGEGTWTATRARK